jgi:hypothetical protein
MISSADYCRGHGDADPRPGRHRHPEVDEGAAGQGKLAAGPAYQESKYKYVAVDETGQPNKPDRYSRMFLKIAKDLGHRIETTKSAYLDRTDASVAAARLPSRDQAGAMKRCETLAAQSRASRAPTNSVIMRLTCGDDAMIYLRLTSPGGRRWRLRRRLRSRSRTVSACGSGSNAPGTAPIRRRQCRTGCCQPGSGRRSRDPSGSGRPP